MGIDLSKGYGPTHIEGTPDHSWPVCHFCSVRLKQRYPVETFGYAGLERPKRVGDKMCVVAEVECHGEKMQFEIAHPVAWSEAQLHRAFGRTWAFVRSGTGGYKTARMKGRGEP